MLSLFHYEVVEPYLDLSEARQLFRQLQRNGRLHADVRSAETSYERLREPKLLLEYVYLLTHGEMLSERLRHQVARFAELGEDPAKVELLRRVSVAQRLGVELRVENMLRGLHLRDDAQHVVQSLAREYATVESGRLVGLHWVRSAHLASLLHEGFPNLAVTALSVLDAADPQDVSVVVANALDDGSAERDQFWRGLLERSRRREPAPVLPLLDGIFEAGELAFFRANKAHFDAAVALVGPTAGPFLLCADLMPVVQADILQRMAELFPDARGDNFGRLREITARVAQPERGRDGCRRFLQEYAREVPTDALCADESALGRLLDWCAWCGVRLLAWNDVRRVILDLPRVLALPRAALADLLQGVARYDTDAYRAWFELHKGVLTEALRLAVDAVELTFDGNDALVEFVPNSDRRTSWNQQAMDRLTYLRRVVPFLSHYRSRGIWLMPMGLRLSVDDTVKHLPAENLLIPSDIEKNVVFRAVCIMLTPRTAITRS
jgi:hypothetical protein